MKMNKEIYQKMKIPMIYTLVTGVEKSLHVNNVMVVNTFSVLEGREKNRVINNCRIFTWKKMKKFSISQKIVIFPSWIVDRVFKIDIL